MIITKNQHTSGLPDLIKNCSGRVSIVFEDGKVYPLNTSPGTFKIFTKLWKSEDVDSVNLILENSDDLQKLFDFVVR